MSTANAQQDLIDICPAAFYKPNKPAAESFILKSGGEPGSRSCGDAPFFESRATRRLALGGNRSAKSTKLVLEAGAWCVGCRPWYDPQSPHFTGGIPPRKRDKKIRVRFVVSNFETQLEEIMEELKKWWPKAWWHIVATNQHGHPTQIDWFATGADAPATWYFMSHRQNTDDFEGTETDLVVWNEPPPKDKWVAMHRGLVSSGGSSITGATPLSKSDWFWETVITPNEDGNNPDYFISWHSIWDNAAENGGYDRQLAKNIKTFLSEVSDPIERAAREHGAPMHLAGLILSGFDMSAHVIEPFDLPIDVAIASSIDPAGTRPNCGLHIAYMPDPNPDPAANIEWIGVIFDETIIRGRRTDLYEFGKLFYAKEHNEEYIDDFGNEVEFPYHPSPSHYTMIDPAAEEVQKADSTGRSFRQILSEDCGIDTTKANKQGKRARLMLTNARCRRGHYRIFNTCRKLLSEIRAWSWDPDSAKLTRGPDDMCDNWTYIDMTDPFRLLQTNPNELPGGIYVPELRKSQTYWRAVEEMRREKELKYAVAHGLKPI